MLCWHHHYCSHLSCCLQLCHHWYHFVQLMFRWHCFLWQGIDHWPFLFFCVLLCLSWSFTCLINYLVAVSLFHFCGMVGQNYCCHWQKLEMSSPHLNLKFGASLFLLSWWPLILVDKVTPFSLKMWESLLTLAFIAKVVFTVITIRIISGSTSIVEVVTISISIVQGKQGTWCISFSRIITSNIITLMVHKMCIKPLHIIYVCLLFRLEHQTFNGSIAVTCNSMWIL